MAAYRFTEDEESFIREHHAKGESMSSIGRALGISAPDMSRGCKRIGLIWMNQNYKTTQAVKDRLAYGRAMLAEQLLNDALEMRTRLYEEYEVIVVTRDGVEHTTLDLPDAKAVSDFTKAVNLMIKTHADLENIGAASSADYARSMLGQLKSALIEAEVADTDMVP